MEVKIPSTLDIRKIIENIEKEHYRFAFMYQFLIGGEISEICGANAPVGTDAHLVSFQINNEKVPAVLFVVKNIRPHERGSIRACALLLDERFEPWTRPLYEWFKAHGDSRPFSVCECSHSRVAKEIFGDLKWPKAEYRRAPGEFVERRYKSIRSGEIRKIRRKNFYMLNGRDLADYGKFISLCLRGRRGSPSSRPPSPSPSARSLSGPGDAACGGGTGRGSRPDRV